MAEVTMVENKHRRGPIFWVGLLVGVLISILVVVWFWFVGWIDLFPSNDQDQNNNNELEEDTLDDSAINNTDSENVLIEDENNTSNNNVTNDTDEDADSSEEVSMSGVTAVLARDVDDSANPIGETTTFTSDDERVYIVLNLNSTARASLSDSVTLKVTWMKGSTKISDYSTDLSESQSRVYFYQSNPGAGSYTVKVEGDGKVLTEKSYTIQ